MQFNPPPPPTLFSTSINDVKRRLQQQQQQPKIIESQRCSARSRRIPNTEKPFTRPSRTTRSSPTNAGTGTPSSASSHAAAVPIRSGSVNSRPVKVLTLPFIYPLPPPHALTSIPISPFQISHFPSPNRPGHGSKKTKQNQTKQKRNTHNLGRPPIDGVDEAHSRAPGRTVKSGSFRGAVTAAYYKDGSTCQPEKASQSHKL